MTPTSPPPGTLLRRLKTALANARNWQLDALDAAMQAEMQHGAMSGDDPLTDCLRRQLECAADEGARPPVTTGAGLTPQQWRLLADTHREGGSGWMWIAGALLAVACALAQVYPMGWAS